MMAPSKRSGIWNLYCALFPLTTNEQVYSIVFVHGLRGRRLRTWQYQTSSQTLIWPRDLLAKELSGQARVWTYGYNAAIFEEYDVKCGNNKNTITQHGEGLKLHLEREMLQRLRGHIIFVAHSLGGLLVKCVCVFLLRGLLPP